MMPRARDTETKINKWAFINLKSFFDTANDQQNEKTFAITE